MRSYPTRRWVLRNFAQWLAAKMEIIHPHYPQGKMCEPEDMDEFADEYWELFKKENS